MENKEDIIKRRAPPPPVSKKPTLFENKNTKSKVDHLSSKQENLSKIPNGSLKKKLTTPLAFTEHLNKVVANVPDTKSSLEKLRDNSSSEKKKNHLNHVNLSGQTDLAAVTKEFEKMYPKPKIVINHLEPKTTADIPKSEKTNSLTEVSNITGTWKTDERVHHEGDDTLDFTLSDEGFDTSTCIEIEGSSPFKNEEIMIVPPPPPVVDFSDDESSNDESLQLNLSSSLYMGPVPPSPTESLNSEFFIPPPPPPDIDEFSENSSIDSQSLLENTVAGEFDFSLGLSSQGESGSDLELPGLNDDNIQIGSREKFVQNGSTNKNNFNLQSEPLSTSINLSTENEATSAKFPSKNVMRNPIPVICIDELKNKIGDEKVETKEKMKYIPTFFEGEKTKINDKPLNMDKNTNSGKTISSAIFSNREKEKKKEFKTTAITAEAATASNIDVDSGHSTAQSQEVSDSEKKLLTELNNEHSLELLNPENKSRSRESSTTMRRKVFRKSSNASRTSKTWSSYDSTDEEETEHPLKVNLREMLLNHMHSLESDTDTEYNFDRSNKPSAQTVEENKQTHIVSSDSEIETHLNDLDVNEWTSDDVGEWLTLIGLPHLKRIFAGKDIDGKALIDIDMKLLDEMDIDSNEDQELILSEIYALQNPGDGDLELSMLDALEKSSGEEREKMLALIKALQAPSNESYINSYLTSKPSLKDSSKSPEIVAEDADLRSDTPVDANVEPDVDDVTDTGALDDKEALMRRLAADVYDPTMEDDNTNDSHLSPEPEKTKKKSKRKGFFASLRRKGNKKNKSDVSQSTTDILSQSNPQGVVKILYTPPNGNDEIEIRLLVSLRTTSKEVCRMCLDYLSLHEDVQCFFIVISRKDRKVQNVDLTPTECPLMFQYKWTDLNTYQFELKQRFDGYIIVNNEDILQQEMISVKLGVSSHTTAKDIIPVLLKKFKEKEDAKSFFLQQSEKDDRIPADVVLLDLPLSGYKFHVFKLVNSSSDRPKPRTVSFTEVKKMETKVSLLQKQVDKLTNQVEEYKRSEAKLKQQNEDYQINVRRLEKDIQNKTNELKKLQDENQKRDRHQSSPMDDKETNTLKEENNKLQHEMKDLKYQLEHYEKSLSTYKESKILVEKDFEKMQEKNRKLNMLNEELKDKMEGLQSTQRNKSSDSSEQMKKLYSENKDNLNRIRLLEDKLAETEHRLSQQQIDQETDSAEVLELRNRTDVLEHQVLEKDSKLLELEYKIQKKERDIRELEDQMEDEQRKKKKEMEAKDVSERKNEDLLMKMDNLKQQMVEKEKHIQSLKNQINKQEKKLNKQKSVVETERNERYNEIQNLRRVQQDEISVVEGKLESLQKLLVEKDLNRKQNEFDFAKQKEELQVTIKDLERKLSARDVIIERLENKLAKSDLNISSHFQDQQASLQGREEKIQQLEMQIAKLESEQASKLREMGNNVRTKENVISKLENRVKKMETSNRDNVKKFETLITEKDRLLQQVNDDRDKEAKELKTRVRTCEENLSERDKQLKDITRKTSDMKTSYETRMKKRDKEYRQQKFLLEKVLEIVNNKSPSLLLHLQESLDNEDSESPRYS